MAFRVNTYKTPMCSLCGSPYDVLLVDKETVFSCRNKGCSGHKNIKASRYRILDLEKEKKVSLDKSIVVVKPKEKSGGRYRILRDI